MKDTDWEAETMKDTDWEAEMRNLCDGALQCQQAAFVKFLRLIRNIEGGRNPNNIEDLQQEVLLRLVRHYVQNKIKSFATATFVAFVRTITHHTGLDLWRKERKYVLAEDLDIEKLCEEYLSQYSGKMDKETIREEIQRAFQNSGDRELQAVALVDLKKYPLAVAAKQLKMSLATLKRYLQRGRNELRSQLKDLKRRSSGTNEE